MKPANTEEHDHQKKEQVKEEPTTDLVKKKENVRRQERRVFLAQRQAKELAMIFDNFEKQDEHTKRNT